MKLSPGIFNNKIIIPQARVGYKMIDHPVCGIIVLLKTAKKNR